MAMSAFNENTYGATSDTLLMCQYSSHNSKNLVPYLSVFVLLCVSENSVTSLWDTVTVVMKRIFDMRIIHSANKLITKKLPVSLQMRCSKHCKTSISPNLDFRNLISETCIVIFLVDIVIWRKNEQKSFDEICKQFSISQNRMMLWFDGKKWTKKSWRYF